MWKNFLPGEIILTLEPSYNAESNQIRCTYQIDNLSLLDWISRQVLEIIGDVDMGRVTVTANEITFDIPKLDIPYHLNQISPGPITIKLKKE